MLSLLLSAYLGVTATCTGPCPDGVSVTITFTATIVSSSSMAMTTYPLELEGAYKVVASGITTGIPESKQVEETYLVWDQLPGRPREAIVFAWREVEFEIENKYTDVLVMKWSEAREALAQINSIVKAKKKVQIAKARREKRKR